MKIIDMMVLCAKIANSPTLPARITDWAEETYCKLNNRDQKTMISIGALLALEAYENDEEEGLAIIDRVLAGR